MAKKRLKVTGDFTGSGLEDFFVLNDSGIVHAKAHGKVKVVESFGGTTHDSDTHLGIFNATGTKTITWTYALSNDDVRVQALGAGEQVFETYKLKVSAKGYKTVTKVVTVTVNGTNDDAVISSDGGGGTASINVIENATAVTTVTVDDPDINDDHFFSIVGGADFDEFSINSSTGALSFIDAPDFEDPTDIGTDNAYEVHVQVNDGLTTDLQQITVNVIDAAGLLS
jgi:VCBS repeat-containing protein